MKKLIYSFLILLCVASTACHQKQTSSYVFATYNVRNANRGDSIAGNGWGQRYPYIALQAQFNGFDIFGTQEAKH